MENKCVKARRAYKKEIDNSGNTKAEKGNAGMTDIKIYNGNQIGGCITVISSPAGKVMIDFGANLPGAETSDFAFDWETESVDAVLFTHYHGDHIGRFKEIPRSVSIYMGSVTRQVMTTIAKYTKDTEALQILQDDTRVHEIKAAESFVVKDIRITPYLVDHSAYDACMYLLETPDKTILHTGDFRGHGHRGSKLVTMIDTYICRHGKRKVDVLLIEGTMLSRLTEKVYSEADMLKDCIRLFEEHKYVFLICSSTNADTLATFYQAANRNGIKMFANPYVCEQISHFRDAEAEYLKNTNKNGNTARGGHRIYDFKYVYPYAPAKVIPAYGSYQKDVTQEEIMRSEGFCTVIKAEEPYKKWIERFKDLNPVVVYSMWEGYLHPEHKAYNENYKAFLDSCSHVKYMHTSGHATAKLLAEVINAVSPAESIYPIHTENAKELEHLNIKDELRPKIRYEETPK